MESKLREYPARDESSRYSRHEIARQAQTRPHDDLAGKPTSRDAHGQNDDKAFARYVHLYALANRQRNFYQWPE